MRARTTLFSPEGTQDTPVELKDLTGERTTFMEFEDGLKTSVADNWMKSDDPRAKQSRYFKGRIVFKLNLLSLRLSLLILSWFSAQTLSEKDCFKLWQQMVLMMD